MTRLLGFGDDRSAEADFCWRWIDSHRWEGWRLEVVTTEPHPDMSPVEPEEARLHHWEPESPRVPTDGGFAEVEHLRAEIDPRVALIAKLWDLLAIGPRGSGLLKSLHLGSTADWLLREPTSPLVIARQPGPVRDLLFAADGSVHAQRTLDTLSALPWIDQTAVRVVAVDDGRIDAESAGSVAAEVLSSAGAQVEVVSRKGGPTREIIAEIEATDPDLVAMGARGIRGIKRLVIGSTTAAVAGSTECTLLVAHAMADAEGRKN